MLNPSISICVPVYNGTEFLTECLESVRAQTYGDYEVLLVDDRSSDGSLALLEQYADGEQRAKIRCNEKNLGLVRNWNQCILRARGEWIKFLFQDDCMYPQCLERMMKAASESKAKMVTSNRQFHFEMPDDPANDYYKSTVKHLCDEYDSVTHIPPDQFSSFILHYLTERGSSINFIGEPSNILFHKDVVGNVGLFNPLLIQSCDYEYWSRVGSKYGVTVVPEILSEFRIHSGSTTSRNQQNQALKKRLDLPAVLCDYLYDASYTDFRQHIGEKGQVVIQRYLIKLLYGIKNDLDVAESIQEGEAWRNFLNTYPACKALIQTPNARHIAIQVKKYVKDKIKHISCGSTARR
jgi:glycosyltransferase involved in cell wall biosynthesis